MIDVAEEGAGVEVKKTLCWPSPGCHCNCGLLVRVKDNKILSIKGNPDFPYNRGSVCAERMPHFRKWLDHPDQLMHPLKRQGERGENRWERISWEQALDEIAAKLQTIKAEHGAESLSTIEGTYRSDFYAIRARFLNLFGNPANVGASGTACACNKVALAYALAGTNIPCILAPPIKQLNCLVLLGRDYTDSNPVRRRPMQKWRAQKSGAKMIVIDPRQTEMAKMADMWLQIRPGTDTALLMAWINVIIARHLYDREFVEQWTYGFEQLKQRAAEYTPDDLEIDRTLRPKRLVDYLGQTRVKENLGVLIEAARGRDEPLDHILLSGPPGLGKTTLAQVIANELGVQLKTTSGPAIERAGDLAAILTNLDERDVLFIDEIHRLNRAVEEVLYPAMEDYTLDIVIGKGPAARSIRLDLPRFTMIGATTRTGLLTGPLRDRFGMAFRLDYYNAEELQAIVERSAGILGVSVDTEGAAEIARRSRGTPRLANRLLKRVRDYAQVRHEGSIDEDIAAEALAFFEVDHLGLDTMDNKILTTLARTFTGRPVGLNTLASAVGEEPDTLEDVYEPYLLQLGLLMRTPKGRQATARAFEHLGMAAPASAPSQEGLF